VEVLDHQVVMLQVAFPLHEAVAEVLAEVLGELIWYL
jgi:hypothetical protein